MLKSKTIVLTVILLLAVSGSVKAGDELRVLHFPKDRSIGMIKFMGAKTGYQQSWNYWHWKAEYIGEAQGDVVVPADKMVGLFLYKSAFEDLSPLLDLEPDDIPVLFILANYDDETLISEKSMECITHLTGLKVLSFQRTRTTTKSMQHITKLRSLEYLVPPRGLRDRWLSYIAQLESLKGLALREWESRVTNAGVNRYLPKMAGLEELELYCEQIDDSGLVFLAEVPNLVFLNIRYGNFTDAGMAHVKKCKSLRVLDLISVPITDVGVRHLSSLDKLEDLNLFDTEVTDRGLKFLKSMRSLKRLSIRKRREKGQITDAGMVYLAQIKSLERLELSGGITAKGAAEIAKLKNLKYLCGGCDSDLALKHLSNLHSLEYLLIGGPGFTDAGMDDLAKLTNLKELNLTFADSITNEGLAKLRTLKLLERLNVTCESVTISGLSCLNGLENLSELVVQYIRQDNSGLDLSGLAKLEKFRLNLTPTFYKNKRNYEPIRDKDLMSLAKLKKLKELRLGGVDNSEITDAGIAYLKDLPELSLFWGGSWYLTDKSLSYFANSRILRSLIIHGDFTDEGLIQLEKLKGLLQLKVYSANKFSRAAIKRLKDSLPNLYSFTAEQKKKTVLKINPEYYVPNKSVKKEGVKK